MADAAALPPVVDVVEAGRWLGLGRTTAYRLAQRGEFPVRVLRIGGQWRVATGDLLDFLNIPISLRPERVCTV